MAKVKDFSKIPVDMAAIDNDAFCSTQLTLDSILPPLHENNISLSETEIGTVTTATLQAFYLANQQYTSQKEQQKRWKLENHHPITGKLQQPEACRF